MSAEPSDAAPHRITLPRTIRAVRTALTAEERERFAADLDDSAAGGLAQVVERWWMHAVINATPGAWTRLGQAEAGTLPTLPAEDVLPELRTAR
jgi:hypothetical protein